MNHKRTYYAIITRAQQQFRDKKNGYYEAHHIYPRCLGGEDSPSNLVLLTAKEHFVVHHLLCYMYPRSTHLHRAFKLMRDVMGYRVTAALFSRIKSILHEEWRQCGTAAGNASKVNGTGIHSQTREYRVALGRMVYAAGKGAASLTPAQRSLFGQMGNLVTKERGTGIYGLTPDKRNVICSAGGQRTRELGRGIHSIPADKRANNNKRAGATSLARVTGIHSQTSEQRSANAKISNAVRVARLQAEWVESLARAGFPAEYQPSIEEAKEHGLKYYWTPGKVCRKDPSHVGKRRTSNSKCAFCRK